jgi:predicted  nucleic acid-binding Zn-ribbon protein
MSFLSTERSDLERKERALRPKRDSVAESVTAQDMDLYVKLRRAKHGVAVAAVSDGVCAVCGIELPRPLLESAAGDVVLARCLGCGRILAG